jgi:hypothetical protein
MFVRNVNKLCFVHTIFSACEVVCNLQSLKFNAEKSMVVSNCGVVIDTDKTKIIA